MFKAFKKFFKRKILLKEKLQIKFNCSSNMTDWLEFLYVPIWNWNRSICLCQLIDFICNCLWNKIIQSLGQIQSCLISMLEIKTCGLSLRIQDAEVFWYKTEIKIIYFVPLCLIVFDHTVYHDPKFLIFKTKNGLIFFWG